MTYAVMVGGGAVLFWFTGYAYGSVVRFLRRIFGKIQ